MKDFIKTVKLDGYRFTVSLLVAVLLFLFPRFSCLAMDKPSKRHIVGGPCEYREYMGQAKIVSVKKREVKERVDTPQKDIYEVKFSFHTDQVIQEPYVRVEGKEYLLLLKDSSYPGARFLGKYGIEVGKAFPCCMKVITKGTCTPIIFDFPTVDLSDSFETP